jgi:heme-degrading monooxygenase HmoA
VLAKPWVTFRRPDPEREYLVLLSALPLKRFRDLGAFVLYTWRIQGQLRRTPGLLGYSLLARILQRQFWTLSVWEGEAALQQFVIEPPHSHVMRALQGKMGQTHFVRWSMRGAELPPRWQEALARQDAA